MEAQKLASLVMREINDQIAVADYGHGHLVTLPLAYWDNDQVTLFVEPFESGYRVTDRGSTAVRLHMTGMNVEAPKVADAWRRSLAALELFNPGDEDLELAHFTTIDRLGEAIMRVAEASLKVDQLRWLHVAQSGIRFNQQVVGRLVTAAGERRLVRPNAPIRLRHGRTRPVTAAVGDDETRQLFVQAVGGSNPEAKDRQVEHCTHLFHFADGIQRQRLLAIVSDTRDDWSPFYVGALEEVAELVFFGESNDLDMVLRERLAPALS